MVAYFRREENATILIVSWGSWARKLGESLEILYIDFVSLIVILSSFSTFGT